ncbi:MAG: ABC transporter permease [Candidatus Kapabacteria bacterium]|nr:ABC transporter permease [Ignavibacteriota bacterium]MCW5886213.1 ABC transporter permease [Candidatus Kapabacteria bacterium]
MFLILKIAWRNIWRNWRRSILTILAVIFAAFFITLMKGIQKGTFDMNIKNTLELFTGYMQIQKDGYQDNPTLNKAFSMDLEMLGTLQGNSKIKGFSPKITAFGLIGYENNSLGAAIFGIDPSRELLYSNIGSRLRKGTFLNDANINDIVIGDRMIKNLGASIGDTVVILTQAFDGSTGNQKFVISGIFKFGSNELDGMTVFMHISAANELLAMNNKINTISLFLHKIEDIPEVKKELDELMEKKAHLGLVLLPWDDILVDLKQTIDMKIISEFFYVGILVMIVGFGILNTVLMSITERFREFGVMIALGTKNYILVSAVFIETMMLTAIGLIFGFAAGYGANLYIVNNPIILPGAFTELYQELGFLPEIHSSLSSDIFIYTGIIILVVAVVVFIYPAYRLSKLTALKGIRYT